MPFTYEIDEDRAYIAVSASGKITAREAEPTQIVLRVFRDIDEARRWLEEH